MSTELQVYTSATEIRRTIPALPDQLDYERKLSALKSYAKDKTLAIAAIETAAALADTLDEALERGDVTSQPGKYLLSPGDKFLPCNTVNRWRKVRDIGERDRAKYYPEVALPTRNGLLRWWQIQQPVEKGGDAPSLEHCSWEDWLPSQSQCDLLITDPPYSTDVDDINAFASAWLPQALQTIKPTGRGYVCIGAYPAELAAYLAVANGISQVLVWSYKNTMGPTPVNNYVLNWQAILYFVGPDAPPLDSPRMTEQLAATDIPHPARSNNRWHQWQKPDTLAERFIRHSTKPGDIVFDPFAGTGTFLLAAAKLGRHAIGCEIDDKMLKLAKARGCRINA